MRARSPASCDQRARRFVGSGHRAFTACSKAQAAADYLRGLAVAEGDGANHPPPAIATAAQILVESKYEQCASLTVANEVALADKWHDAPRGPYRTFSKHEGFQIVQIAVRGCSATQLAAKLGCKPRAVERHGRRPTLSMRASAAK